MSGGSIAGLSALIVRAVAASDAAALRTAHGAATPAAVPTAALPTATSAAATADAARVLTDVTRVATIPRPALANAPAAAAGARPPLAPPGAALPATPAGPLANAGAAPPNAGLTKTAWRLVDDFGGEGRKPGEPALQPATAHSPRAAPAIAADDLPVAPSVTPPPAVWKEVTPPPVIAALPLPVRWYERVAEDEDDGASRRDQPERQSRFLAEVDGGETGRVQLDGLLKSRTRRVSLIVRSERPLDKPAQRTVERIFADGAALAGWDGELAFRDGAETFVAVGVPTASAPCRLSV